MPCLYRSRCFSIDPRRLNKPAGFSIRSVWTRPVILSRFFPSLSDRPFSYSLSFPPRLSLNQLVFVFLTSSYIRSAARRNKSRARFRRSFSKKKKKRNSGLGVSCVTLPSCVSTDTFVTRVILTLVILFSSSGREFSRCWPDL